MMRATRTVCIAFAVDGITPKLIGVYTPVELAHKRVKELENLGLLNGCRVEFFEEVLWEEVKEND